MTLHLIVKGRVNSHLHLPALRTALDEHLAAQLSVPSIIVNP